MNIKEQIQKRGFTVSQVATLMTNKNGEKGITQSSLSQIINGNPSLDKLKEIASIIGVTVSELLQDKEDNTIEFPIHSSIVNVVCPKCGTKLKVTESKD